MIAQVNCASENAETSILLKFLSNRHYQDLSYY